MGILVVQAPMLSRRWILPALVELLTRSICGIYCIHFDMPVGLYEFVIITFIRNPAIRIPLMIIMLGGWAFELLLLRSQRYLSNQNILWVLWQERARQLELARFKRHEFVRDWAVVMILGIVLCASPAPRFSVSGIFGLLPIVSGALVAGVIVYTKGGTQDFPIPFGTYLQCRDRHVGYNTQPEHDTCFG